MKSEADILYGTNYKAENKQKENGQMTKTLYELLNPSDRITFYAKNDEIARAVTLILGEGKAGCRNTQNDERLEHCMTAFGNPAPQEVYDGISKMLKYGDKDLAEALNSVAVCGEHEREIYDDYTNNSNNAEKCMKWDSNHRTSVNTFVVYSKNLAKNLFGRCNENS